MIYPTLYISEDNSTTPYIQLVDGDLCCPFLGPILIDPIQNPVKVLYDLFQFSMEQWNDGFDEGFWEGMNNIDDEMEDMS